MVQGSVTARLPGCGREVSLMETTVDIYEMIHRRKLQVIVAPLYEHLTTAVEVIGCLWQHGRDVLVRSCDRGGLNGTFAYIAASASGSGYPE